MSDLAGIADVVIVGGGSAGAVKGVSGLRVAAASIIPEVPSSTTNVTTIMLAERVYASWPRRLP
jgi:choline dehydrogenase-like flavoprotein